MKPNNEPAFPSKTPQPHLGNDCYSFNSGMTIRDFFANNAMMGILMRRDSEDLEIKDGQETIADAIAANAYFMADAMLLERNKQP